MPNLNFKYGASYNNLPEAISNGTIYVTKNEKAMYVDLDGSRLRLGQTIVFPTWEDFDKSVTLPPESPEAFYYIEDKNALLKYVDADGGYWNQINSVSDIEADLSDIHKSISALQTLTTSQGGKISNLEAADIQINATIDGEIERAKAAEKANADNIVKEANRAQEKENELEELIDANTLEITNIKNNYVTTTTYNAGIKNLQDQITSNDGDIKNLQDDLSSLESEVSGIEERVVENTSAINGLNTTVIGHTSQITDLNTKTDDLQTQITNETARAKNAEQTNANNLTAEINRAQGEESRIEGLITNLGTTVSGHANRIGNLENKVGNAAADGTPATGLFKAIADETARAQGKESELAESITEHVNTLQDNIDANTGLIDANALEITNIKNNYVTTNTYNAGVKDLQDQITSNDGDIKNLQNSLSDTNKNLESTTQIANDNTEAISGLETIVTSHGTSITDLNSTTSTLRNDLTSETNRAKAAEEANAKAIDAETNRAQTKENELSGEIGANSTKITDNSNKIATNTANINKLTTYVGTLPEDTSADNVVAYIQEQFAAANAMVFKDGITAYEDLPTTGVEAGFTYIVLSDFVYGGVSYYAGDLIVAAADQTGSTYTGGWTHVNTGYSASQENKLVMSGNGAQLQSYAGTNLGALVIASAKVKNADNEDVDQINIATNYNSGTKTTTVTLSLEWGTF